MPHVKVFPNTTVGRDITLQQLQTAYTAVILAYGAGKEKRLRLPPTPRLRTAKELVDWYNGFPTHEATLPIAERLKTARTVAIIGQGNVAADCARLLLADPTTLAETDVPPAVFATLKESKVQKVLLIGRRGPCQLAMTTKELRELVNLPNVRIEGDVDYIKESLAAHAALLAKDRPRKRLTDLLLKAVTSPGEGKEKVLRFLFLASPKAVAEKKMVLQRTTLQGALGDAARAVATNDNFDVEADLFIESLGSSVEAIDGVPFGQNVLAREDGQVVDDMQAVVPGLFACGWCRSGSAGVLLSTMADAYRTASTVQAYLERLPEGEAKTEHVTKGLKALTLADWLAVEHAEADLGASEGRTTAKMASMETLQSLTSAKKTERVHNESPER